MKIAARLVLALPLLTLALPLTAQQAPPDASRPVLHKASEAEQNTVIPVQVKEVNLLAVVRDKKGQPVNTLTQADFALEQDGRAQKISQFARDNAAPLIIGILADTGPSQRKALGDERKSATDWINKSLREQDKAFVLHFDTQVELLQDITGSKDRLARGIDQISLSERQHDKGSGDDRHRDRSENDGRRFFFGGGMLYDAIFLSSDEVLKGQKARKAIIVFSDGRDSDSRTTLEHAIESAQRAEVPVYCIYVEPEHEQEPQAGGGGRRRGGGFPGGSGGPFPGGGYPGGGSRREPESRPKEDKKAGIRVLERIAQETGGRYFELTKKQTAEQIYAAIGEELKHQYSLSYTPDHVEQGFHKLHLTTKNGELVVSTRAGFYAE